ncbi:hypothetical protein J6590_106327, partial [Homalodisca vitripennis]
MFVLGPPTFAINPLSDVTTLAALSHTIWMCSQYYKRQSNITPTYLFAVIVCTLTAPTVMEITMGILCRVNTTISIVGT